MVKSLNRVFLHESTTSIKFITKRVWHKKKSTIFVSVVPDFFLCNFAVVVFVSIPESNEFCV